MPPGARRRDAVSAVIWRLDHLAVAAATLEEGAEWVGDQLGVRPGPGGEHAVMGTHNRLMSIGPGVYLEVIAVDPDAPPPGRPRWFGLDHFSGPPRLTAWVVRTEDLEAALAVAPPGSGTPLDVSRGAYSWRISVPDDGLLPLDGVAPALIQWIGGGHPCDTLPPNDLRLSHLEVAHPARLAERLPRVDGTRYVRGAPRLRAILDSPEGERELS